ncbi:MAG: hypothetical protein ACJAXT_000198 [Paracoccaceae bacterium]|jgi:hypothetical protein
MIRYSLKCPDGHDFDSWFQSGDAFDTLNARGLVACMICGKAGISKAIMTPRVAVRDNTKPATLPSDGNLPAIAEEPTRKMSPEQALKALKAHIDTNSTYVGGKFAQEARKMHLGDAPERMIHGEANPQEVKSLLDDGIAIAPLPIIPKSKAN